MGTVSETGTGFTAALAAVALAAGGAAYHLADLTLGAAAGVVAVYVLHRVRVRVLRNGCWKARVVERLSGELGGTRATEPIVSRRFGPEAVALIEGAMEPSEVVSAMAAARRPGRPGFGQIALERGYLTKAEIRQLREAREEGRFLRDEVRHALRKLEEFARG